MKENEKKVSRRAFMNQMGMTVGAAAVAGAAGAVVAPQVAEAAMPKGKIPDKPFKTGHITFLTGAAAILADQSLKGHILAAEEINANGGLLGKRKIETIQADEAAGTDANVKEVRRMKLQENVELFTGVISSGNTPAIGPVCEELGMLTMFTDGCTDFLFDVAVPEPHYIFRITSIQSSDGVSAAVSASREWPEVRKIAHIHPDYSYGRNALEHFTLAIEKFLPGTEVVSVGWPKLGTTDFTPHLTKALSAKPDLLLTACWGGDYVALYKQALRYGVFDKMKWAATLSHGTPPHAVGKDHPEGTLAGVHANFYFTFPPKGNWPIKDRFVEAFQKRWGEFPGMSAEGAYVGLNMVRVAIEKANQLVGGWPDDDAIITMMEGLGYDGPAGYYYIRPDNHQGYKDATSGFSKNFAELPFSAWDLDKVVTIPVRNITAPPNWPKPGKGHNDSTATANWIKSTWPSMSG